MRKKRTRKCHPTATGCVYFVRWCDPSNPNPPIKVGWSESWQNRVSMLQMAIPYDLEVLRVLEGHRGLEEELHWLFRRSALRGEWFQPDPAVMLYIKATETEDARGPETVYSGLAWSAMTAVQELLAEAVLSKARRAQSAPETATRPPFGGQRCGF